jgi:hypothetical protein
MTYNPSGGFLESIFSRNRAEYSAAKSRSAEQVVLVRAFITCPITSRLSQFMFCDWNRLIGVGGDLTGAKLRLTLDIGRERNTWMPPTWAASGRRLEIPLAVELQPGGTVAPLGVAAFVKFKAVLRPQPLNSYSSTQFSPSHSRPRTTAAV